MFTGIVSDMGMIVASKPGASELRLRIACTYSDLTIGESVACNGACLTVVGIGDEGLGVGGKKSYFEVDLSSETLTCTAPHQWRPGVKVNLERALTLGERLSGHFVTGHVDGLAAITNIAPSGGSQILTLEAPAELMPFIAEKGSVTLDGVSLTVNKVEGNRFEVNIIPHSLQETTLGERGRGDHVNVEIDLIARYVQSLLKERG